ncbi:MAG: bifunctional riboflavin kinase/FAD synthetase [Thermodesulfobacteriota bacterium]|jgi:riboflavin kinase/FMN adenylyltransferase
MEIIRHVAHRPPSFPHPILSLGNFDGVHLGHQAILTRVVQEARARHGTALAFTFYPHTLAVLRPDRPLALILSVREKLLQFACLGIDGVILQRFSRTFSRLSPEEFVRRYLVETLRVEKVVVGHNVSFGHKGAGRAETLEQFGRAYGFAVEVVGPVRVGDREVSSTAVRALLSAGNLREVTRFLGRPYAVSGRVGKGFQRGRDLGFPTANLRPRSDLPLPNGVYAVLVEVGGIRVPGVANVGVNPTFAGNRRTIEAHLFDFAADLYGARLRVSFIERLRGEQKFPSVQALVQQIQEDATRARTLLSELAEREP